MDLQKVFGSNKNDVESQMQPNVQSNSVPFYPAIVWPSAGQQRTPKCIYVESIISAILPKEKWKMPNSFTDKAQKLVAVTTKQTMKTIAVAVTPITRVIQ